MSQESGKPETRKALGKGLSALLGPRPGTPTPAPPQPPTPVPSAPASHGGVRQIPVELIQPNPYQPRRTFNADRLNDLAASIKASGVVQPILVRPSAGDRFELVAGERRWRASKAAGLATIPAVVQEVANDQLLEIALIENIQREDLNPIETAQAFEQLAHDFALTHEQIAQKTGKDRATITNFIRLLKLAPEVQAMLSDGALTMGHAKVLAGFTIEPQKSLARRVVEQGLTVRALERIAAAAVEGPAPKAEPKQLDPNTRAAVMEMERTLGTRVRIIEGKRDSGRIEIDYHDAVDLQRIYTAIMGEEGEE